jgi:hypothetical protein
LYGLLAEICVDVDATLTLTADIGGCVDVDVLIDDIWASNSLEKYLLVELT